MAFTVEDGTGVAGANSYAAIADADSYFSDRGITAWAALSDAAKQTALIVASEYADLKWGSRLKGIIATATQGLLFPRIGIYDTLGNATEGVPLKWQYAIFEYAIIASAGSLYPLAQTSAKEIESKTTVVGPIKTSVTYVGANAATKFIGYPAADSLARLFVSSSGAKAVRG